MARSSPADRRLLIDPGIEEEQVSALRSRLRCETSVEVSRARLCNRIASCGLLGAALVTRPAAADPPTVAWHAPDGCGTTADLLAAVTRLLRPETTDAGSTEFDAKASLTRDGQWTLTLVASSSRGGWTRQVRGATCRELREAVDSVSKSHPVRNEALPNPQA